MHTQATVSSVSPARPGSFVESAMVFAEYAARLGMNAWPAPEADARRAAVMVSPWSSCPLPWFALTTACLLRREGLHVSLIWNDLDDTADAATFAYETQVIEAVMQGFRSFDILRLGQQPTVPTAEADRQLVAAVARLAGAGQGGRSISMTDQLSRSLPHVQGLFARHRFDFAVVPGGKFGNAGLLMAVGQARGVRMSTYDADPGRVTLGLHGPASHAPDLPRTLREADRLLGLRRDTARQLARTRLRQQMESGARLGEAAAAVVGTSNGAPQVVIPLNQVDDSEGPGRHRFFRDDSEWLNETIAFLIEHTQAQVIVRQHPADSEVGASALANELGRRWGGQPRFRLVRAAERISTYQLLAGAHLVLPYTSRIGIEAAMLGKPVVVESLASYAGQLFAVGAADKPSYFQHIAAHVQGPMPAPELEKVGAAELYYFFAAVCNAVETCFTPYAQDFATWSQVSFDELAAEEGVKTLIRALTYDIPAAVVQGRRVLDRHQGPSVPEALPVALPPQAYAPPPPVAVAPPAPVIAAPPPVVTAPAPSPSFELSSAAADRTVSAIGLPFPCFPGVTLGTGVQIIGMANVEIGQGSCIGDLAWLNVCVRDQKLRMRIGRSVLIGRQSMVSTGGYLEIGDHCLFGPRVTVVDADHGFADITRPYAEQTPTLDRSIIIEENCWLAVGAVVAGNLTVGRGSVVGANAVVTQDVPPFCVVVGHPARIVKMYDPVTRAWEPAKTDEDQQRILQNRQRVPLPDRAQYQALLRQNARAPGVIPIVAGRGECL